MSGQLVRDTPGGFEETLGTPAKDNKSRWRLEGNQRLTIGYRQPSVLLFNFKLITSGAASRVWVLIVIHLSFVVG